MDNGWEFIDHAGSFSLAEPHKSSYLYFPLANECGMMSSITPILNGDIKTGQNAFFSVPAAAEDLHHSKYGRNFWVYIHGVGAWSAAGVSSLQAAKLFSCGTDENARLEAGFLWHRLIRENKNLGIKSEIINFVPANNSKVELMRVCITNTGMERITITPTAAIPVYGRSADNIRDHRHVTSLLGRTHTMEAGIEVQPVMTFDERGHKQNQLSYNVYGVDESGSFPTGTFPCLQEFIGEGGCLEWPECIVTNKRDAILPGDTIEGYEAIGALRFKDEDLMPGESRTYIIMLSVTESRQGAEDAVKEYLSAKWFQRQLSRNMQFWEEELGTIGFNSSDPKFDLWMKWVSLQPVLRRIYGCSFMPHHDYGKGGRGWRDLWQDCLALLLMEPGTVRSQLLNNFGGIRMDGTNATIIGKKSGEFIADRNNISRVWSDHGVWPLFTTLLYINQSGDLDFLSEQQVYFKDRLVMRCRDLDSDWTQEYGNRQKCGNGEVYTGSILEHILIQNLAAFFNVGENNNIRLENADWNDALDMACDKGETVAFTAFYAGNLIEAGKLLKELQKKNSIQQVELASETVILLDTLGKCIDYNSPEEKTAVLQKYLEACRYSISGTKVSCAIDRLIADIERKAVWLKEHIGKNEWVKSATGYEWFNGYYDNSGKKVEGDHQSGARMTLTGQVFPVMMGIAAEEQVEKVVAAVERYLFDKKLQGYRLNTDFKEIQPDLGRCFGFAYGHKENGAIFSHMVVMYAAALYRRGFVTEGYKVIESLYLLSADFEKARIYPGIPEYFNDKGRGMYHYLTGSASWLLLVLLNDVYGVRGGFGDLVLEPKLKREQFDLSYCASVKTVFAGSKLNVIYRNCECLDYGEYSIKSITIDNCPIEFEFNDKKAMICRNRIELLKCGEIHNVEVTLSRKPAV
jgi:cellobiose phosphorylase